MATTRIMSIHANKGKSVAQTITDRTDYADNPDKTRDGELISSFACDKRTVDAEFYLAKQQYKHITGRTRVAFGKDVLAYHIRQAFKPGEITPEDANQIGYELAKKFTKGKHAFIVATHIDKAHIHNHIIFNSTNLTCDRKFRDFLGSARAIRRISDTICIENGLSIIANPKPSRGHYGTWLVATEGVSARHASRLGNEKVPNFKDKLQNTIDNVLARKPSSFEGFLEQIKNEGYEIKIGKHISFRAAEQKRPTRLRSLGDNYSEDSIRDIISGTKKHITKKMELSSKEAPKVNLLIDIQNSIKAKGSPGYERWAKIFNLKQAAQTLIFLQENDLTDYDELKQRSCAATANFNELSTKIKSVEARLSEISDLQKHISNYGRTREIYTKYRKSGYSEKFLTEHESEIALHQFAKEAFDSLRIKKLPTIKSLKEEYATLDSEKKKLYQYYRKSKEEMKKFSTVKANADRLLQYNDLHREKENER